MELISRKEALERGLSRYFTGKPCKHGHVCERLVSCWLCVECNRTNVKKQAAATPNRAKENKRRSDRKNNAAKVARRQARTGQKWLNETVRDAIKYGGLTKLPCFCCGAVEVEGHHPDYGHPLSVVWLCRKHHQEIHNGR